LNYEPLILKIIWSIKMNIKHLKIEKEGYITINSELDKRLENLSKVNIFIGANNSGKSRFMRSLFYEDSP